MRRAMLLIFALILLRCWFGARLSLAVPAWEAYDESGHFAYAVELSTGVTLNEPNPERIQPPLYYGFIALLLRVTDTSRDLSGFTFPERNPYFYYGGGVNYALHRTAPSEQTIAIERALHFSRLLSLLLTLPAICFAYRAARRWQATSHTAVMVAALVALWPQGLFNGSMVSNDGLTLTIGVLLTWLLLEPLTWKRGVLILVFVAIGGFIKLNLLLLLLPFATVILLHRRRPLRWIALLGTVLLLVVVTLNAIPGVLLPFFQPNSMGSPIEMAWSNLTSEGGWQLITEGLGYLLYSNFGLFGWGTVPLPEWIQVSNIALILLGLIAGLLRHQIPLPDRLVLVSIFLAPIIGGLGLTLYYHNIHLLTGRYLLLALSALAVLLVIGWGRRVSAILLVGIALLDLLLPVYIANFYARPPALQLSSGRAVIPLLPGAELVDYDTQTDFPDVTARLCWRASQPIDEDYVVRIEIIGADGGGYGLLESIPGNANHPTTNWVVDEVFCDNYTLPIRSDAPTGLGYLRVTMLTGSYSSEAVVNLEDAVVVVRHE